jgi:uncharacterized protein YciI
MTTSMTNTFILHCIDGPGTATIRAANREAHAAYMRAHAEHILMGGPLLAPDGVTRIGIMAVLRFSDTDSLQAFTENEPYRKAGVFTQINLHPMQVVMQAPSQ